NSALPTIPESPPARTAQTARTAQSAETRSTAAQRRAVTPLPPPLQPPVGQPSRRLERDETTPRAPLRQPRDPTGAAVQEPRSRGTTETVVQVTIDRIEIRAPAAPAQPAPMPRGEGARPMGLDEYLRRRSGGRP